MIRRKFIHNSPYTDAHTHTLTHIRTIFAAISLSLCHSVVALIPGGFHVQLVLLEWSAAAPKAATATASASARRQRWQRPAFITVCAFWVFFCLFSFWSFSFLYTLQHLFVSNYCGNLFIRQQSVQTKTTTTAAKLTPQGRETNYGEQQHLLFFFSSLYSSPVLFIE